MSRLAGAIPLLILIRVYFFITRHNSDIEYPQLLYEFGADIYSKDEKGLLACEGDLTNDSSAYIQHLLSKCRANDSLAFIHYLLSKFLILYNVFSASVQEIPRTDDYLFDLSMLAC